MLFFGLESSPFGSPSGNTTFLPRFCKSWALACGPGHNRWLHVGLFLGVWNRDVTLISVFNCNGLLDTLSITRQKASCRHGCVFPIIVPELARRCLTHLRHLIKVCHTNISGHHLSPEYRYILRNPLEKEILLKVLGIRKYLKATGSVDIPL